MLQVFFLKLFLFCCCSVAPGNRNRDVCQVMWVLGGGLYSILTHGEAAGACGLLLSLHLCGRW